MASQMKRLLVTALRAVEQEATKPQKPSRPKCREGKKTVVGHFVPEVSWQLRKLALDQQTTVQKLLEESLNDLFEKYHLPRV